MRAIPFLALLLLTACAPPQTAKLPNGAYTICMQGVLYYKRGNGIAPAFKQDGTLYLCNTKGE